ncbi:hypothetical protein Theam_1684 [Thermovibrio ammonificans HB-1]|uniref:Uncharacterized protein n=1 Tax=Thermovibrio ammonificans (strain DSM 15698 / JCM 12110 / HB-1) TaxID=648996 RepID=E8T5I6_THEA1|nr:hypothetical protein [Thermovibrio ammonificans]ADU97640.1 hypothetical protein Theam_1684 [Thermovibrio ammonificans HB-1]
MAAKNPLTDPAVPDGAVDGINPADEASYKGFNFDMGTMNHNITCNSCHAGGGAAQFGREKKPLDEVLRERIGDTEFEKLKTLGWFIHDENLIAKTGIDGDLLGYSDYEVGAGYLGKPGVFNFARSGVNDTDCFMCHADASQTDKMIKSKVGGTEVYPIMPANPRVMVFKGLTADNETIVISLGIPPKKGEVIGGKVVDHVDSAYYNSVPVQVLAAVYNVSDPKTFIGNIVNGTDQHFYLYPNNANGATREVARVVYFEHPESTKAADGGEVYVNGGAVTFKDDNGQVVYRTFAGYFFKYISTASLMGVDTNQNGVPLAYVRFVKDENGIWKAEVYYDKDEFDSKGEVDLPVLENRVGDKDTPPTEVPPDSYTYSVPEKLGDANEPFPEMTKPAENRNREWGLVCSYCHMAIPYKSGKTLDANGNTVETYTWVTRKGTLGLAAEIVKRGDVFSYDLHRGGEEEGNLQPDAFTNVDFTNATAMHEALLKMESAKSVVSIPDPEGEDIPIGYDVHFDSKEAGLTCLSCHGEGTLSPEEKEYHPIHHDFLKGNDWGGHWDQSLDYNPSLKTCLDCHFGGSRQLAADVHSEVFGPSGNAAVHMEKVSCEVCHIPYKTHWTFRTFYDVVGYSYNFDNRMLAYDLANGTVKKLPVEMFTPGFGPFMPIAGYGAPQPFCITKTSDGKDTVVPIYQADFDPRQAALRLEQNVFGIWKVPKESFPWGWATVIINNGFRPDTPGGQKFMYRLADPLTLVTWYDKSTGKVLYTREIAAALDGAVKSDAASSGLLPAGQTEKRVPAYFIENGKVCVKTILGDYICDDNGDYLPEIDTDTEYEAMKSALKEVLKTEGVKNPEPVFYIWTAPFSIDHGVLPKEYALGAGKTVNGEELNCSACHDALNGRLPQANMSDIESSESLQQLIVKDDKGHIKYFGLGRQIVTVPVKIPAEAYKEAVRVFFNSPENADGSPKYGTMNGKEVMVTTAGDILVNALTNGLDVDRHLVPIPVESSGIEGIAFALNGETSSWKMKFDGVEAEVETEALYNDDVPRRAIVLRLKNELPELLGLEHLADEILAAGPDGLQPVFTPIIPSEYIEKIKFSLANLGVTSIDALYINATKIHKVRVSEGENVYYEVDKEQFHPTSIPVTEAIAKGWASYDSYTKELSINVAALRNGIPGEGELAFSVMRQANAAVEVPQTVEVEGSETGTKVDLKVDVGGKVVPVTVTLSDNASVENVLGNIPTEEAQLVTIAQTFNFSKLGVAFTATATGNFQVTFENGTLLVDPNNAVVGYEVNGVKKTVKPRVEGTSLVADIDLEETKAETRVTEPITVALGETSTTPTATAPTGGGGGGCAMTTAPASSGLFNLGVILSGLLGLFGLRRKRRQ